MATSSSREEGVVSGRVTTSSIATRDADGYAEVEVWWSAVCVTLGMSGDSDGRDPEAVT